MKLNSSELTHQPFLLARQPIFDDQLRVVAYELLFRQIGANSANIVDGDSATSQLLIDVFTHFDIDAIVGNQLAYVNFTRRLIGQSLPFDKSRLVVEVLEDIEFDDECVELLKELKQAGYTIALDDFVIKPGAERVLPLADIVKFDVMAMTPEELADQVQQVRVHDVSLLAEKIETHEEYAFCRTLGFTLFQGYFLSKPEIISGRQVPADKMAVLQLLSKLQETDCEITELEQLINRDPVLGFKIMKLVNSALYANVAKIDSLNRAISYLGMDQIRSLASLLALSNLSDKPSALKTTTMIRAKMCEILGRHINHSQAATFFSVGLLSTLDAYFDQSLQLLLENFSLNDEIAGALLARTGNCGKVLTAVMAQERAEWDDVDWKFLANHQITPADFAAAWQESLSWQSQTASA